MDTNSLRAQGFPVEEVAGACFCCRFDDLVAKVGQLEQKRPARRDPGRAGRQLHRPGGHRRAAAEGPVRRALRGRALCRAVQAEPRAAHPAQRAGGAGFSPKAAYIFRKQLEEADAIVINRIDELRRSSSPSWPSWWRRSTPACRCCRCRRRPGRASRRWRSCSTSRARSAARSRTSTTTSTPRARRSWAGSTPASASTTPHSRSASTACCSTWSGGWANCCGSAGWRWRT